MEKQESAVAADKQKALLRSWYGYEVSGREDRRQERG
jgi:hypothetical protein